MARRSRRTEDDDYRADPEREADDFETEEDDEAPRRRRKSRRSRDEDDEEEEAPRRRKRRSRDEDDAEEEEAPRRKRRSRDDDDEEEPRRRKSRRSRDEEDDEEDDDDEPRKGKGRRVSENVAGWGGYKKAREKTSSFAQKWKPEVGTDSVVKFLDDEPFASYAIHWFDELGKGKKKGWMCLESIGEERCPACSVGDRPKGKALFAVVAYNDDGEPESQILEAGTWLADQLENLAESKNGPLSKHYWVITPSGGGKKGPVNYSLSVLKERDEEEWDDWELDPLTDDELEEFGEVEHTLDEVEKVPSYKEFKAVVDSLDD